MAANRQAIEEKKKRLCIVENRLEALAEFIKDHDKFVNGHDPKIIRKIADDENAALKLERDLLRAWLKLNGVKYSHV